MVKKKSNEEFRASIKIALVGIAIGLFGSSISILELGPFLKNLYALFMALAGGILLFKGISL